MKPKSLLLLLVAGGCGLVAALAVTQHLSGNQGPPQGPPPEPRKNVVVAKDDLKSGTKLKPEMLQQVERLERDLPEGVFTDMAEVTGETLSLPIFKGELVLKPKLGGDKTLNNVIKNLPAGMLAATVKLEDAEAPPAGLINPHDRVDVWCRNGKAELGSSTKTLMRDVEVLAVGQRVIAADPETIAAKDGKAVDTSFWLMVTEAQKNRLNAAKQKGKVEIAPRANSGQAAEPIDEDQLDVWLGIKAPPQEKPAPVVEQPAPPKPQVAVYEIEIVEDGVIRTETINVPQQTQKPSARKG